MRDGSFATTSRLRMFYAAAVAALLLVLGAELLMSSRRMSQTADEGAHLYAGYQHWRAHDFGVNPEHPPLVKLVAAAPLLGMELRQPHPPNPFFFAEEYIGGDQLLYGNDADRLLLRARTAVVVFPLLLGLLVFAAGYEMFGPVAGLMGLALFTFEPTVLGHGALVTTDMAVSLFVFASVYAFYRYVKEPGVGGALIFGLAFGLALATKMSGVIVLPIVVICAAIVLIRDRERQPRRGVLAWRMSGAIAMAAVVGYGILWAFYGFRYTARPAGLTIMPPLTPFAMFLPKAIHVPILFLARWHLLPEAYLYGWTKLPIDQVMHPMFLLGKVHSTGVWFYFPVALAIKSSLTLLVLAMIAPVMFSKGLRQYRRELLFLLVPAVVILLASRTSHLDIGVRHVLPMYPFAAVLAGASGWTLAKGSRGGQYAVAALLLFQAISSVHAFPDYLPYANEAFGGSGRSYRLLSDSNVDWGQELKEVSAYLRAHPANPGEECWFAYSLPTVPQANYGIPCKPLPTGFALWIGAPQASVPQRITGRVLVGAMDVSGTMWGNGDMNPYRQFRDGRPEAMIGNTVLVYKGSFDVPLVAAQARYSGVTMLLRQGKGDEAIAEARAAAAMAPDSAHMQAKLGGALKIAHRDEEAEVVFAKAMQMAKDHQPDDQSQQVATVIDSFRRPMF